MWWLNQRQYARSAGILPRRTGSVTCYGGGMGYPDGRDGTVVVADSHPDLRSLLPVPRPPCQLTLSRSFTILKFCRGTGLFRLM